MLARRYRNPTDAAERVQENVTNLPITSISLAGLLGLGLGAGVMALLLNRGPFTRK